MEGSSANPKLVLLFSRHRLAFPLGPRGSPVRVWVCPTKRPPKTAIEVPYAWKILLELSTAVRCVRLSDRMLECLEIGGV